MNAQVGAYPPVMFDEKMYIGKDLSAGGPIGNIGFRRAPASSAGVPELYRARTHEERDWVVRLVEEGIGDSTTISS